MKNTTWNQVEAGQIVSFIYKSQTGKKRSARRVVFILAPRFSYRKQSTGRLVDFVVGLEIYNNQELALQPNIIKELFELLGQTPDKETIPTDEAQLNATYKKLEGFLKKTPIFKTYFFRECRKRRVFLEDQYKQLNNLNIKSVSDRLTDEITDDDKVNQLEANLED